MFIRKTDTFGIRCLLIIGVILIISCFISTTKVKADDIMENKLDSYIKSKMDKENIPGLSIGVIKNNKIVYVKGYGKADQKGTKVTEKTPFILGSVSKSFTALAVMKLQEEGKLDIDEPVKKYLPWFKLKDKNAQEKITLRNLLNHNSGLSNMTGYKELLNDDMNLDKFVKNLKNTNTTDGINSKFQYSNIGYDILGKVIEEASGVSYSEYIETNIFKPLNMKNSYARVKEAKDNGLSTGYFTLFGIKVPFEERNHEGNTPAGYLVSSAEDMANYLLMYLQNGNYNGNSIIKKEGINEMHKPAVRIGSGESYGMGWVINSRYTWHNGGSENFASELFLDKKNNSGVVILFNTYDNLKRYDYIAEDVMSIIQGNQGNGGSYSVRSFVNIVAIVVAVLMVMCCIDTFSWIKEFQGISGSRIMQIVEIVISNAILPCIIAVFLVHAICYRMFMGPVLWMPDIAFDIWGLPLVLMISGLIKIICIIKS